jgi:tRNA modification GTPase
MDAFAAVMTGPGTGAIATIQLFGASVEAVLREVFRRKGGKPLEMTTGRVLLGCIVDDSESIDEVTIGCEGPHTFAIHCHGNPLIVERIIKLLQHRGVQPVSPDHLLLRILAAQEPQDAISIEAKLVLTTVKTVEGAVLVTRQVKAGLAQKARQWRDSLPSRSLEEVAAEASQILRDSEPARLIISGCTIALIGPPNTGKSTLLNTLAGREKAVVTDIRGTTRDWVSAEIHIPPLAATIIDTAGLDAALAANGEIDQAAQRKSTEILERADLIVLVLDGSRPAAQISPDLVNRLSGRRTLVVLNKADLPPRLDPACLPEGLGQRVPISAKLGASIEDLIQAIHRTCGLTGLSPGSTVAFTNRQRFLIEQLSTVDLPDRAVALITELLLGRVERWTACT